MKKWVIARPLHEQEALQLTGAVIRLGADGFYYQAELTDRNVKNSVIYCRLEEITTNEESNRDQS